MDQLRSKYRKKNMSGSDDEFHGVSEIGVLIKP